MAYTGAIVAAAAERRRQMQLAEEEENVTGYTPDDLQGDWEFKIVRSDAAAFHKPEAMNQLVEEEARAGWVLLEKFDDGRVRFKRPRTARARDAFLPDGVDPYRTQYGAYNAQRAMVMGAVMALVFLLLGMAVFGYMLVSR